MVKIKVGGSKPQKYNADRERDAHTLQQIKLVDVGVNTIPIQKN